PWSSFSFRWSFLLLEPPPSGVGALPGFLLVPARHSTDAGSTTAAAGSILGIPRRPEPPAGARWSPCRRGVDHRSPRALHALWEERAAVERARLTAADGPPARLPREQARAPAIQPRARFRRARVQCPAPPPGTAPGRAR